MKTRYWLIILILYSTLAVFVALEIESWQQEEALLAIHDVGNFPDRQTEPLIVDLNNMESEIVREFTVGDKQFYYIEE